MKQLKFYFVYFALAISLYVLFTPARDSQLPFPQADKVVHITTFALLALGLLWRKISWKLILGGLFLYAVASEIIQHFWIPGREFDLLDIASDTVGILLVLGLGRWQSKKLQS